MIETIGQILAVITFGIIVLSFIGLFIGIILDVIEYW